MKGILPTGTRLTRGGYIIEKALGQGSFGVTYRATTQMKMTGQLGTLNAKVNVAVKEFFMSEMNVRGENNFIVEGSEISMVQNYRRKFRKEAENLSHLKHPGIVKVLSIFDENNTTYYVMEYLEGESLDQRITRLGKLEESQALDIIRQVGSALQYMHEHQMLHLDLKPGNIMCCDDGRTVLIDFGLSKQYDENGEPESSTTLGLGTMGYAPIEQADYRQDGTFPATLDIYALGATLFKMLTGKRPLAASMLMSDDEFLQKNLNEAGASPEVSAIVCKAMALRSRDRYQRVADFLQALPKPKPKVNYIEEETEHTILGNNISKDSNPAPSVKGRKSKPSKRAAVDDANTEVRVVKADKKSNKGLAAIIAIAGVAGVALAVFFVLRGGKEEVEMVQKPLLVRQMKTSEGYWSGRITEDSLMNGHGELRYYDDDADGRSTYTGGMKEGQRNGKGILIYKNGVIFDGMFEDGYLYEGTLKDPSQNAYFVGTFKNNSPYDGEWFYMKDDTKFATIHNGVAE